MVIPLVIIAVLLVALLAGVLWFREARYGLTCAGWAYQYEDPERKPAGPGWTWDDPDGCDQGHWVQE